jgi:hypothetical protein
MNAKSINALYPPHVLWESTGYYRHKFYCSRIDISEAELECKAYDYLESELLHDDFIIKKILRVENAPWDCWIIYELL